MLPRRTIHIGHHFWPAAVAAVILTATGGCAAPSDRGGTTACDDGPVIMVVSGVTLDRERMGAYAQALAASGLYASVGGYYLNQPRPVAIFEGTPPADYVALMVRFPSLSKAREFWDSPVYQNEIKPLRLSPSAGDYTVVVYRETGLPDYMDGRVGKPAFIDPALVCPD